MLSSSSVISIHTLEALVRNFVTHCESVETKVMFGSGTGVYTGFQDWPHQDQELFKRSLEQMKTQAIKLNLGIKGLNAMLNEMQSGKGFFVTPIALIKQRYDLK